MPCEGGGSPLELKQAKEKHLRARADFDSLFSRDDQGEGVGFSPNMLAMMEMVITTSTTLDVSPSPPPTTGASVAPYVDIADMVIYVTTPNPGCSVTTTTYLLSTSPGRDSLRAKSHACGVGLRCRGAKGALHAWR